MSSESEKPYSLEELKRMNAGDLSAARQGERYIQVTEKNWTAVLKLLERVSAQQLSLQAAFDLLLTREEAQSQLDDLYTEAELFAQQAGSLSESFASSAERLAERTQTSISKLEDSARRSTEELIRETAGRISELAKVSRRCLLTQGVVTVALTVLATVLLTLAALWKMR